MLALKHEGQGGLAGAINAVRARYLLAKVWELETVSTPGELGMEEQKTSRSEYDLLKGAAHAGN